MSRPDALRVLICRLSAVGDSILTMPLLCALRDHLPNAFVAWIIEPAGASLLRDHAALDELIIAPKGWLKSPQQVRTIGRKLRGYSFDVVLDPQSLTKSSVAGWLSRAPRRIGFAKPRGRELSLWLNNHRIAATHSHLVDAQLELLRPLGIEHASVRFGLPTHEQVENYVEDSLRTLHLQCPFAVINVGAGWESRLWPTIRYGRVAKHLGQKWCVPSLVVWSGERERSWAEEVVAASGGQALLAPPTSLPELGAILRRAKMYVGSDTGPMHLAAAVGTACIALFGTTRPEDSGPYGSQHFCVQHRYQAGSSRQRRKATNDAMCGITIAMVTDACDSLLSRAESEAA